MRIYSNAYELMSETGRNLTEMGTINKPKTYQNQVIEGKEDFETKELICEQYCLTDLPDPEWLFCYTHTKSWADAEFSERISGDSKLNPGKAWLLNQDMWSEFLVRSKDDPNKPVFDYTYAERMNVLAKYNKNLQTYLDNIISLLKDDNDTRKAVLSIFNPSIDANHLDGVARIPCSMYYDFLVRLDAKGHKQLNICYHQRSCDFIGHFGDDVYLAWSLMQYVAEKIGVKQGYLYHTIDSLHAYKKDWWLLKTSIDELDTND